MPTGLEIANALRETAEFFEAFNEDLVDNNFQENLLFYCTPEQIADIAHKLPGARKEFHAGYAYLTVSPNPLIKVSFFIEREKICKKIEKIITVPAQPAREAVPEHEETTYEWDCSESSFLALANRKAVITLAEPTSLLPKVEEEKDEMPF